MENQLLNLPPMDTLRGFVAVARRMSITQAAQDLCLTQSAVSRQIQALEQHLGTAVFIRKHRALVLTDTGTQLFKLTSPWLDRLSDFTHAIRQDGRTRPVMISASIGVASLWILPKLGRFQEAHPHIDVRVAANNRLLDLKQEGIDLAIRYCRAGQAPQDAIRLFGEQVVPVANKPLAAKAFKNKAALLLQVLLELDERTRPWLRWSEWLEAKGFHGVKPKAYLHFNQYDQVIQAAVQGHGVALGRLALIQPLLEDGSLTAQPDAVVGISDYGYWLVDAARPARPEVEVFREWIIEEVRRGERTAQSIDVQALLPTIKK